MIDLYLYPQYIQSRSDLERIIKLGHTPENITLDFKAEAVLSDSSRKQKKDAAEELALDICQFSNTWGGVLLIGVKEEVHENSGQKVASEFTNSVNFDALSEFINNNVLPLIHPPGIEFDIVSITAKGGEQLVAINVFPLAMGVSCVYINSPPYVAKYPYRTNFGKKYFHPAEVEKRMVNSNRSIPIKLREISLRTKAVTLYPAVSKEPLQKSDTWESKGMNVIFKGISNYEYTLNINGVDVNIPFSLTKDIWLSENDTIGILLSTKLIISSDRKSIILDL